MNKQEKLKKIKDRCREILELGKLRTQGAFITEPVEDETLEAPNILLSNDAKFFAACAGTAEAMARSTLVALDELPLIARMETDQDGNPWPVAKIAINALAVILESWPDELL